MLGELELERERVRRKSEVGAVNLDDRGAANMRPDELLGCRDVIRADHVGGCCRVGKGARSRRCMVGERSSQRSRGKFAIAPCPPSSAAAGAAVVIGVELTTARGVVSGKIGAPAYAGSMPVAAITCAACGVLKKAISSLAAAGSGVLVPIAALNTVVACTPGGSGPTSSAPLTGRISLIC